MRAVVRSGVEHRHDVRVVEPRDGLRFTLEPLDEPGVLRQVRLVDLDRDRPIDAHIHAAEDLGHPALADAGLQPVLPAEYGGAQHPSTYELMIFGAIGAATCPPVGSLPRLPPFRTITATTSWGSLAGAKDTNP